MKRKCLLHIGLEKTGTSSIQHALTHTRDALLRQGVLYPASLGLYGNVHMTIYAQDDDKPSLAKSAKGLADSAAVQQFRSLLKRNFSYELQKSGCDTVIISDENLSSHVLAKSEMKRLKHFLDHFLRT